MTSVARAHVALFGEAAVSATAAVPSAAPRSDLGTSGSPAAAKVKPAASRGLAPLQRLHFVAVSLMSRYFCDTAGEQVLMVPVVV